MRRARRIAAWAALSILAAAAPGRAQVPNILHFQGVLTDDDGLPVTDTLSMTFRLFADTTAPPLWSVTKPEVAVLNGFYEVMLEPAGLPFDEPYFLGIQVGGAPLGPKRPLASVPYAWRSAKTRVTAGEGLSGTSDSAGVRLDLADLGVSGEKIAQGAVTGEKLADKAVITEKLNDGAVTAVKIAPDQIVRSVNGIRDHVVLEPGANMAITQEDSILRFSAVVSGEVTDADWEIAGNNMFSLPSGNVGVGTSSPGRKLDVSGGDVRTTGAFISTAPPGAPPLTVSSTTLVANLNADLLDGKQASELAEAGHAHAAVDITSGTIDYNRLPVGTTTTTVAQGQHAHSGSDIASGTIDVDRLPVGTGADEVAAGNHTHPGGDGDWTISGSDLYSAVSGNVGIGTSSPAAKLDVSGKARVQGKLSVGTNNGSDDDTIAVDNGSAWLQWYDAASRFRLNKGLVVGGPLGVGAWSLTYSPVVYNYFASSGVMIAPASGEMNTSGDLYVQNDFEVGDQAFVRSASVQRDLSIGDESNADKDTLFFGKRVSSLSWEPSISLFHVSNDIDVHGRLFADDVQVDDWLAVRAVSVADSVLAEHLFATQDVSIGRQSGSDNDSLRFDSDDEAFVWDNTQARFELSSDLAIGGLVSAGFGTLPAAATKTYNYIASTTTPEPAGGDMGTGGDLYVGYDLEVGQDLYYVGGLVHIVKAAKTGEGANELGAAEARGILASLRPRVLRSLNEEEGKEGADAVEIGFLPSELPDLVKTADKSAYRPLDLVAVLAKIVQEQQATIDGLEARLRALEEGRR